MTLRLRKFVFLRAMPAVLHFFHFLTLSGAGFFILMLNGSGLESDRRLTETDLFMSDMCAAIRLIYWLINIFINRLGLICATQWCIDFFHSYRFLRNTAPLSMNSGLFQSSDTTERRTSPAKGEENEQTIPREWLAAGWAKGRSASWWWRAALKIYPPVRISLKSKKTDDKL